LEISIVNSGNKLARLCFHKSQRIVKEEDFTRVLTYKCFVCKGILRLYAASNGLNFPRFGVSVGKTLGKAVYRNKCKRLAREAFRLHQHEFAPGFDYILIFAGKKPKRVQDRGLTVKDFEPTYEAIESNVLKMAQALQKKSGQAGICKEIRP
jgi:ribonuclease P protein component